MNATTMRLTNLGAHRRQLLFCIDNMEQKEAGIEDLCGLYAQALDDPRYANLPPFPQLIDDSHTPARRVAQFLADFAAWFCMLNDEQIGALDSTPIQIP